MSLITDDYINIIAFLKSIDILNLRVVCTASFDAYNMIKKSNPRGVPEIPQMHCMIISKMRFESISLVDHEYLYKISIAPAEGGSQNTKRYAFMFKKKQSQDHLIAINGTLCPVQIVKGDNTVLACLSHDNDGLSDRQWNKFKYFIRRITKEKIEIMEKARFSTWLGRVSYCNTVRHGTCSAKTFLSIIPRSNLLILDQATKKIRDDRLKAIYVYND